MASELLHFLLRRRSAKPALLAEPGPSAGELTDILTAASRVPDHKKVEPWRFIVFEGDARAAFGNVIADVLLAEDKERPSEVRIATERGRFTRAPLVIAVISSPRPSPPPEWEQVLSAGAVAMNLCLAANALGYGTAWITEWVAFSAGIAKALGLASNERVAGFVYIGTNTEPQPDRERPDLDRIVTRWRPQA
jgi:nitroreductase